jgi:pantoate--beta-alanine ligase
MQRTWTKWIDALQRRQACSGGPLVARTVQDMRDIRTAMTALSFRQQGEGPSVGFVPTMGALHAGHLSLCAAARGTSASERADFVVASVFVNPTQFAPHEDLTSYPRTWETDLAKLDEQGVDVVFAPTAQQMYPPSVPHRAFVELAGFDARTPEGVARPGFFRGVATVVTKLFSVVQPTHACFGQKDGIQCIAVRQLVRDLNLPVRVDIMPTLRDPDGLAMSSRNTYLNAAQRAAAPAIHRTLQRVGDHIRSSPEGQQLLRRAAEAAALRRGSLAQMSSVQAESAAQAAAAAFTSGGANATVLDAHPDEFLVNVADWASQRIIEEASITRPCVRSSMWLN